ncbi:MAG TPA: hypothetical protein VF310_00480, partial [Vicinamibacteria bacterium]
LWRRADPRPERTAAVPGLAPTARPTLAPPAAPVLAGPVRAGAPRHRRSGEPRLRLAAQPPADAEVEAREERAPVLKLVTRDPDVIIFWSTERNGGEP